MTSLAAAFYSIVGILLHLGLGKKYPRINHTPAVSILIAARNEEKYLPMCLESLENQRYPRDKMQVILINDRSTDHTRDIAQSFCNRLDNFQLLDISEDRDGLKGKMNALAQALDRANGEIILITDADCRVPQDWVSNFCAYFTDNVGLAGSLTLLNRTNDKESMFDRIQALDWMFLQTIAAGTAGINLPVSVLGNNFGFRKSVYEKIGGFRDLGFSLTEDMVLLKAIAKKTDYRIIYPLEPGIGIYSYPLLHLSDFFAQRRRWLSGGLKAPLWGWLLMIISFVAHLLLVLNLIIFNWTFSLLISFIVVLLIDLSLVARLSYRFQVNRILKYFPIFEIFYISYTIIFAVSLLLPGRIKWKERTYHS